MCNHFGPCFRFFHVCTRQQDTVLNSQLCAKGLGRQQLIKRTPTNYWCVRVPCSLRSHFHCIVLALVAFFATPPLPLCSGRRKAKGTEPDSECTAAASNSRTEKSSVGGFAPVSGLQKKRSSFLRPLCVSHTLPSFSQNRSVASFNVDELHANLSNVPVS